jgi:hypothetical protein
VPDEGAFLETAAAAGESTWAHGSEVDDPSQCHGLVGSADLFLELARQTRAPAWQERAAAFALRVLAARVATPTADAVGALREARDSVYRLDPAVIIRILRIVR